MQCERCTQIPGTGAEVDVGDDGEDRIRDKVMSSGGKAVDSFTLLGNPITQAPRK